MGAYPFFECRYGHKSFERPIIAFVLEPWSIGLNNHLADGAFRVSGATKYAASGHRSRADINACVHVKSVLDGFRSQRPVFADERGVGPVIEFSWKSQSLLKQSANRNVLPGRGGK
ncbi:hypothetical protein D3C81_1825650 [compost metagenome]